MLSQEARSALEAKYLHLTAAANKIRKPENWIVGQRANNSGAHCALGALDAIKQGKHGSHYNEPIVRDLAANIPVPVESLPIDPYNIWSPDPNGGAGHTVARYNNVSSHAEVIAWFDKTAAGMKCILDADDAERAAITQIESHKPALAMIKEFFHGA